MSKTSSLTAVQDNLRRATISLESAIRYHPNSSEVRRLQAAVDDLKSNMTEDDMAAYLAVTTKVLTATEKRDLALAETKAMEANRDKPSI